MSICSCDGGKDRVRISDELTTVRDGREVARLRCTRCHGKAGWIPIDALEAFGYDQEDVRKSAAGGPNQIYLTLEAQWDVPDVVKEDNPQYDTSDASQVKRSLLPDVFGASCPNCGDPFDAGSSGILYQELSGTDVTSWVRICTGPIPNQNWFDIPDEQTELPFVYVHKDEHLEAAND